METVRVIEIEETEIPYVSIGDGSVFFTITKCGIIIKKLKGKRIPGQKITKKDMKKGKIIFYIEFSNLKSLNVFSTAITFLMKRMEKELNNQ